MTTPLRQRPPLTERPVRCPSRLASSPGSQVAIPSGWQPAATRPPEGPGDRLNRYVLVVDDEPPVLRTLERILESAGFLVATADSPARALELLHRHRYSVMFCDVNMPEMSGLELVGEALSTDPTLAVVMVSGNDDAATATAAMERGAVHYVTKPFQPDDLRAAADLAVQRREARMQQAVLERLVRDEVAARTASLERERVAMHEMGVRIVQTLVNAMEAKDEYLRGHSQRVADLAASIADVLGCDEAVVEAVRTAGHLHDIGKIGIREEILHKPGPCTVDEFEHVKLHVQIGMDILAPLAHLGAVLDYVRDHHEHYDGSGYPRGLVGEAISRGGRILTAADAFDALTSRRAYREPLGVEETLEYLERNHVGSLLDPAVFGALLRVIRQRRPLAFL